MAERTVQRFLIHSFLALSTLALTPASPSSQNDECTEADRSDNSIFWVTDSEIPMRTTAHPDSAIRGTWSRGTILYGLCWRFIPHIENGVSQQTVAHYMRSEGDGRRGWVIPRFDRPSQIPLSQPSFTNPITEGNFFERFWNAVEDRHRRIVEGIFG